MSTASVMRLEVVAASGVRMDERVVRIVAEAENGAFCLLPGHRDFAAALVPGIIEFTTEQNHDLFLAVDEGVLVKAGPVISVGTRHAVLGEDLSVLRQIVEEQFARLDDREKLARQAVAQLEADFARRFLSLRDHGSL
jgi:F-type H+-transporting ATPase subunit epsilon